MGIEPQYGLIDFALGARFEYVPFHQVLGWADQNDSAQLMRALDRLHAVDRLDILKMVNEHRRVKRNPPDIGERSTQLSFGYFPHA